jgi:hypothetical protein
LAWHDWYLDEIPVDVKAVPASKQELVSAGISYSFH